MNVFSSADINKYPITAAALCVMSYLNTNDAIDPAVMKAAVAASYQTKYTPGNYQPNDPLANPPQTMMPLTVVWGPAYTPISGFNTDSLMYIAKSQSTSEYFVVVRGTNPESLGSWEYEDFQVSVIKPLNSLPGWPANVATDPNNCISLATWTGVDDLLHLSDGTQSAIDFLKAVIKADKNAFIYVTGHSLGGTITPVFFSLLNAILFNGAVNCNMAMWSFAGLTAGGNFFNQYINQFTNGPVVFEWRIQNSLDVAPMLFQSASGKMPQNITDLYNSYGYTIDIGLGGIINYLFTKANTIIGENGQRPPGVNFYQQPPGNGNLISGTFETDLKKPWIFHYWDIEAFYQHHASTYYQMVFLEYNG